jgi:pimeloyl-ACP methyl ester carboxylesterase
MAVCREARIPLCDDDERIGFSFGILDSQGVDVSLFRVFGIQVPFFLGDDGGPPRWFCPVFCSPLIDDAPLLLFLPGMDGTGLGLVLHHESLRRMFEVWCLHIPVHDRTPFEGLLKLVEDTVLMEMKQRPTGPIYLVGDSFGGALALSVAARNPTLDLVLILANPGQ